MELKRIKSIAFFLACVCLIIQVYVLFTYGDFTPKSDAGAYVNYAEECFAANEWYPMHRHLYTNYLFAPGFVNFLIFQLRLFGTLEYNMFINLLLSWAIIAEIWIIAKTIFNECSAWITVIFNSLLYSTWVYFLPPMTEIPFLFLVLTAFVLCLKSQNIFVLFVAGVFFCVANWIRPLAIIYIIVTLLYMFLKKYRYPLYISLFAAYFGSILLIGTFTKSKIGEFAYKSSTGGVNLIMAANDDANGTYNALCFADSSKIGYIYNSDKVTFVERDSIWIDRSINWIKDHPFEYFTSYLKRIPYLYVVEDHSDGIVEISHPSVSSSVGTNSFINVILNRLLKNITYYVIIIAFVLTVIFCRKDIFSVKGLFLLLLIMGTLGTCIFVVQPRYHSPFLFCMILWASWGINKIISNRRKVF